MNEPKFYVDFNEMIEEDLVLLSKTDVKIDSSGTPVMLHESLFVKIYMDDVSKEGHPDNLIAEGFVEQNTYGGWSSACKWNCRISKDGIRSESTHPKKYSSNPEKV